MRADRTLLQDPEQQKEWQEAVHKHVTLLAGASVDGVTATKLQVLKALMQAVAKDVLMVDGRRRPGWFLAVKRSLEPVTADRNRLMAAHMSNPSSAEAKDATRGARKAVQRADGSYPFFLGRQRSCGGECGQHGKFCEWKVDFTASCMACNSCSSA